MLVSSKKAAEILFNVNKISCGGCGYAAYFMWHCFKQENVKIIYCHRDKECNSLHVNEKFKNNWSNYATSCSHVVLKIGNTMLDCTGTRNDMEYGAYLEVTIEHLITSINNVRAWNSEFDRDLMVPFLEKEIGIQFGLAEYKNTLLLTY